MRLHRLVWERVNIFENLTNNSWFFSKNFSFFVKLFHFDTINSKFIKLVYHASPVLRQISKNISRLKSNMTDHNLLIFR